MSPSRAPQPKVVAGGLAAAASVLLIWLLGEFGVDVPVEVGMSITALLSGLAAYLKAGA